MKCHKCSANMKSKRTILHYVESGLTDVFLHNIEVRNCLECGETETVIPRLAQLHRKLASIIAEKSQRVTGAEIRFLRKHLGWSGEDFARTMGVRQETVSRWENQREPMGQTAERLLRLMALRDKPVTEYPNERLADVAQGDQVPVHVLLTAEKSGWVEAEAA